MKQLDPKVVWLFFWNAISKSLVGFFIIGVLIESVLIDTFLTGDTSSQPIDGGIFFGNNPMIPVTAQVIISFFILYFILSFIWAKLHYKYYRYELAELGFKKEYGIIWKRYVTIPYDRIQNVDIIRGLLARIMGLSDLQIQTAGVSGIMATEGRLPGLSVQDAEIMRDELVQRAHRLNNQGL